MRKFTFKKEIHTSDGIEAFSAVEFDSFDEAVKAVEKGIHDRKLQFPLMGTMSGTGMAPMIKTPTTAGDSTKLNPAPSINSNETGGNTKTE